MKTGGINMAADLVWEHIGKYARDPKSGKLTKREE